MTVLASSSDLPPIAFDRVRLGYGARRVLDDVSFALRAGEFVGLLGANGAGKTTLIRAVLGLVPVMSGAIRVLGHPVGPGNPAIGYVPQLRGVDAAGRVSGWNFVASSVGGHRWGLPFLSRTERRDIETAIALVDGTGLARRPLAELSGGERQRLLLAQAIVGRPRLLLMDEPLISLDPHHQQAIVDLVRQIQRELRITVLFSAHDLNPLLATLDRVLYLARGQAALGTVDDVITGPVLSRLYGSAIDVVRIDGRVFVMADRQDPGSRLHQTVGHHVSL